MIGRVNASAAVAVVILGACLFMPVSHRMHGQANSDIKHVMVAPLSGPHGATLSPVNIDRGVGFPSVVHLRGSVEIRSTGFVLRADEAEMTKKLVRWARGDKVTPYPPLLN